MANGKNPFLRYRVINSCLASKRKPYWTIAELIERLAAHDLIVEKRTVELDFETMRYDERLGYNAPIAYCRKNRGYHYTDADYSIDAVPLTEEDLRALNFAMNILHQYKGVQLVNQFEGTVDKLAKVVDQVTQKTTPQPEQAIYFERAPYYKGIEHFDTILKAIHNKQPLRITYLKFTNHHPSDYVVHPYFLKEYGGRWYLLCFNEEKDGIITLALDRIEGVTTASVFFKENQTLKPEEYFQHTLGITHGDGPPETIELWFSVSQGNYIKTQHLHPTQRIIKDDDKGLVISLTLVPNYELLQLLLSYGNEVKVLKPAGLKKRMKGVLERSMELYR